MDYKKYIDLGFTRTEMNDSVEFKQTGYGGFTLEKELGKNQMIGVSSGELNKPLLYIKRRKKNTYHIFPISEECVLDLIENFKEN